MDSEKKIKLLETAVKNDMSKATFLLQKPGEPFFKLKDGAIEILLAINPKSLIQIHQEFLVLIKFTKIAEKEPQSDEESLLTNGEDTLIEKEQFAYYKCRFVSEDLLDIFKSSGMHPVTIELYDVYDDWQEAFFFMAREFEFYADGYDTEYELLKDELNFVELMASEKAKAKDAKSIHNKT